MPENLDAERIDEIKESGETWLIDFWAEWCGPCKTMEPIIDDLSDEMEEVSFGKVNVDDNQDAATSHGVRSIPTFLVIRDGEEAARTMGAMNKDEFRAWIEENV